MSQEGEDYIQPIFPGDSEEIESEENFSDGEFEDENNSDEFMLVGGAGTRRLWPTIEQNKTKLLGMFANGYTAGLTNTIFLPSLKIEKLVPAYLPKTTTLSILTRPKDQTQTAFHHYIESKDTREIRQLENESEMIKLVPQLFPKNTVTTPVFYLSIFMTKALELAAELEAKPTVTDAEKDKLFLLAEIIVRLYILCYVNIFTQNELCVDKTRPLILYKRFVGEGTNRIEALKELLEAFQLDIQDPDGAGIKQCLFGKGTTPKEIAEQQVSLEALYELLKDFGITYFFNDVLNVKESIRKDYSRSYFFDSMDNFLTTMIAADTAGLGAIVSDCQLLKAEIDKFPEAERAALTDKHLEALLKINPKFDRAFIEECFEDFGDETMPDFLFPKDKYGFAKGGPPPPPPPPLKVPAFADVGGTGVYVVWKNQILIQRRSTTGGVGTYPGMITAPGGSLDKLDDPKTGKKADATVEAGALRELREEAQLKVNDKELEAKDLKVLKVSGSPPNQSVSFYIILKDEDKVTVGGPQVGHEGEVTAIAEDKAPFNALPELAKIKSEPAGNKYYLWADRTALETWLTLPENEKFYKIKGADGKEYDGPFKARVLKLNKDLAAEAARAKPAVAIDACMLLKKEIDSLDKTKGRTLTTELTDARLEELKIKVDALKDKDIAGIKKYILDCFKNVTLFPTKDYGLNPTTAGEAIIALAEGRDAFIVGLNISNLTEENLDAIQKHFPTLFKTTNDIKTAIDAYGATDPSKATVFGYAPTKAQCDLVFAELNRLKAVIDEKEKDKPAAERKYTYTQEQIDEFVAKEKDMTTDIFLKCKNKYNEANPTTKFDLPENKPILKDVKLYAPPIDAKPDGWCFWRATLLGTKDHPVPTDDKITEFIGQVQARITGLPEDEKAKLRKIFDGKKRMSPRNAPAEATFDEYINQLDKRKIWADPELGIGQAVANLLEAKLTIWSKLEKDKEHYQTYSSQIFNPTKATNPEIEILYMGLGGGDKNHYQVLLTNERIAASPGLDQVIGLQSQMVNLDIEKKAEIATLKTAYPETAAGLKPVEEALATKITEMRDLVTAYYKGEKPEVKPIQDKLDEAVALFADGSAYDTLKKGAAAGKKAANNAAAAATKERLEKEIKALEEESGRINKLYDTIPEDQRNLKNAASGGQSVKERKDAFVELLAAARDAVEKNDIDLFEKLKTQFNEQKEILEEMINKLTKKANASASSSSSSPRRGGSRKQKKNHTRKAGRARNTRRKNRKA